MIPFTFDWINSIQKTIDSNGCWIPSLKPLKDGYVQVTVDTIRYKLHRISMCVHHNIDYYNRDIETRHSDKCSRACFNGTHLMPGTRKENNNDMIQAGKHMNSIKTYCKHCGREYSIKILKTGYQKGRSYRYCRFCQHRTRGKK